MTERKPEEIEITPEMIEAGVDVYLSYDSRDSAEADLARDIFRAMWRARLEERLAENGVLPTETV